MRAARNAMYCIDFLKPQIMHDSNPTKKTLFHRFALADFIFFD
jgi:hypothetical protein